MKSLLSLKMQVSLGILLGLVAGYLFAPAALVVPGANPVTPTPQSTPHPFTTLPGAWMVRIKLHRAAAPEILKITRLNQGRMTVITPGDSKIRILDKDGALLYEQAFQVNLVAGDPPQAVDELNWTVILPVISGARTIQIVTPNGETDEQFPAH